MTVIGHHILYEIKITTILLNVYNNINYNGKF